MERKTDKIQQKTQEPEKRKYIWVVLVFLAVFILLCLNATRSGLWYDESIEYYFSRVSSGPVPGSRDSGSMYERIVETFQPPLYNWLMFLWLSFFDSEFGFRLAGILTTVLGGIGFFLALKKVTETRWAAIGSAVYLLTGRILIYALECAEYNLMLCLLCWTLCFFVYALLEKKTYQIIGFFLMACLSVYSQYGAVFVILPLYCSLMIHYLKRKEKIRELLFLSGVTLLAAIPLIVFFLIPQLANQGTTDVSHYPVFRKGNLIIDFPYGIYLFLKWLCGGKYPAVILILCAGISLVAVILWVKGKTRPILFQLLTITACTWVICYIATAFSFYGYNAWDGPLGTYNLGGRYELFFVPILLLFVLSGMFWFFRQIRDHWKDYPFMRNGIPVLLILLAVFYGGMGIREMKLEGNKDDFREVEKIWMDTRSFEKTTLVHSRLDAGFQFYLTHDPLYRKEYQDNILTSGIWMVYTDEEEVESKLTEMGIFQLDEFVFVCPNSNFMGSYDVYLSVAEKMGYQVVREYEGISSLLLFTKLNSSS